MSKNSFKVRKGLTLSPVDPSEIINPEAGDLIADSTDDNKIKRYDATSADWASVGGSAGIGGNLMAEFEKLTPDLVNVTSAVDTVTFLPIDDNNKSIKATFSGSVGSIQFQAPIDSSLHEIQGTVSVWIKTSLDNIQISSVQDDVKLSTLPVSGTNKWKQYELPVVVGGAEMGFIVESTTGVTGDVYIDQPFVGLTPSSYGFEVAQSELAFDVNIGTATIYTWGSVQTNYVSPSPPDADMVVNKASGEMQIPCAGTNPSSGLTCSGSAENLGVVFDAKVGEYEICTEFSMYGFSGSYMHFQLVETPNNSQTILQEGGSRTEFGFDSAGGSQSINLCGIFKFDTAGKKTIRLMFEKSGSSNSVSFLIDRAPNGGNRDMHIVGKYYPPKTTIVTQTQEETVETANVFSATVSATGVVSGENLDWINGNCSIAATSQFTCNFNPNIFTVAPNCVVSVAGSNRTGNLLDLPSSTQVFVETGIADTSGFSAIAMPFQLHCEKAAPDYNKSRLIVGQFEQIKTTELSQVLGGGDSSTTALTANVTPIPWAETRDTNNEFNGTQFTAKRDMVVKILGNVRFTAANGANMYAYINGTRDVALSEVNVSQIQTTIGGTVFLNKDDVLEIRSNTAATINSLADLHWISLLEEPDITGIIKNLNDNKTVKYQKKVLGSACSLGPCSDISFNNLIVGRTYQIKLHGTVFLQLGNDSSIDMQYEQAGVAVQGTQYRFRDQVPSGSAADATVERNVIFKATATDLSFRVTSSGGSGTEQLKSGAVATLMELPDYYVETEEFS